MLTPRRAILAEIRRGRSVSLHRRSSGADLRRASDHLLWDIGLIRDQIDRLQAPNGLT
jgi:uncharacterized protein YjiS (DUF1127 family)